MTPNDPTPAVWHDELGHFIGAIFAAKSVEERAYWLHTLRERYNRQIDKRRDPTYVHAQNSNVEKP